MKEKLRRNYNGSDFKMLQVSRILHTMFVRDKELFAALDAGFSDPFADKWALALEEADRANADVVYRHGLGIETEKVNEIMEKCRDHYRTMRYFVIKAFGGSRVMLNLFGQNSFRGIRFSVVKMIGFMKLLSAAVLKYGAELSAAGYPPEYLAMADALWRELEEAVGEKEMYRKERGTLAEERVKKLNECLEYSRIVNRASRIVFAGSPARLKIYTISSGVQPREEKAAA